MAGVHAHSNRSAVLQWVVVAGVGALVAIVVLGLNLIPRLNNGQKVLNDAKPAFQTQSLKADVAGIDFISTNVDMANPIVTASGGAAAEVPKLIGFVAGKTGLSDKQVLAALQKNFPAATHLLLALPLSSVSAELPKLVSFLATTLKLTPAQVLAALKTNFPALAEAIMNLPTVTSGWNSVQGLGGMTDFSGHPVRSVPQVRDYFKNDLIPAVGAQQSNFKSLDGTSSLTWIAPLLLALAIVVILFGATMVIANLRGGVSKPVAVGAAWVVPVVGVVVVALVLIINLVPRTDHGQKLLSGLKPAFTASRVVGDRRAITMVEAIANTENPIMTPAGGAAGEVPKLIAFVAGKTGLGDAQVVGALQKNFPAVTNLLEALPLSSVSAEVPKLVSFLATTLKLTPAQVLTALKTNFPALAVAITKLPAVTGGWNNIPGLAPATNFAGRPLHSDPDVVNYFSGDVIPVLETQRANFASVTSTSNIDFIGPLVLAVGVIVIFYGLMMVWLARGLPAGAENPRSAPVPAPATA